MTPRGEERKDAVAGPSAKRKKRLHDNLSKLPRRENMLRTQEGERAKGSGSGKG